MGSLFHAVIILLLLFSCLLEARHHKGRERAWMRGRPHQSLDLPNASNGYANHRKRAINGSACIEAAPAKIKAPKKNVWWGLNLNESKSVVDWLYRRQDLNLTHYANAGPRTNLLDTFVELMPPNKSDVLAYIDGNGLPPKRYARTTINFKDTGTSVYTDILVGPLPVRRNVTTWQVLGYPYTRKDGTIRDITTGSTHVYKVEEKYQNDVKDIVHDLWPELKHSAFWWDGMSSEMANL